MENTYNYSVPTLADGGGGFEERVAAGYVDNSTGEYTPKRFANTSSTITVTDIPASQVINDFDKRRQPIFERSIEGGREYLTYSGAWKIEFPQGNEKEAKAYRIARIQSGESDFNEALNAQDAIVFTLNGEDTLVKIAEYGLDIERLRSHYDTAEELTPRFTNIERQVEGKTSAYLLFHTLKDFNVSTRLAEDLTFFDNRVINQAKYFFGSNTDDDVGMWRDKANRIRIGYNNFMAYRAKPLLQDLMKYGQPDEYVLGRYPNGTIIFVLTEALSDKFIELFGSEERLSQRWNDVNQPVSKLRPEDYEKFEDAVDITSQQPFSVTNIFGLTNKYTTEKK